MVLELDECCSTGIATAAGEFLRQSSIRGDGDNLEGVDPAEEVDGAAREVGYGDDAGVVVAVEGGVVVVEGGSGSTGDFGTVFGRTVAGLREGCLTGSGLDRRAVAPDVLGFGRRRRSVEEGRFSVASSCWARLRFDFRLDDLSAAAAGVRTGLSPLMSTRTVFRAVPDFMVEVLIRGDWSDRGESRLFPREPSVGRGFGGSGAGSAVTVTVVEGICSKKVASTSGCGR